MSKKYQLLIDHPIIPKGTEATLTYCDTSTHKGYCYCIYLGDQIEYIARPSVEKNPGAWGLIEEPKPSFKKWRAEDGGKYWVNASGDICSNTERFDKYDNYSYLTGNYFQTREEAEAYKARQEAIGRVTHAIIEANEGWEPDWFNGNAVYNIIVEHGFSLNTTLCTLQFPTLFPYCKTNAIALSIISSHKEDLDLIFNVK